jgi:hypothetical protein
MSATIRSAEDATRFNKGDHQVIIYLHGDKPAKQSVFPFSVNPGLSGLISSDDLPLAWQENGSPKEFKLAFAFGECEVDEQLGRWLVKHGMAHTHPAKATPKILGQLAKLIRGR